MVGCKDDPSHKLRHLPSLRLRSPTQDEQHTRVSHWLHTVADTPSNKRHALAELGPSYPRKSARLAQKQRVSAYKMPTSPFKKQVAGKGREGTRHGEDENEAEASVDHVITRSRAQGNVPTASSSEKENRDRTQRATTLLPRPQGAGIIIPLRRPNEILVPPELGSPSKRKDPSSRPSSPTKTTSKSSKKPALVDKRERLELLNPPVKFLSLSHLGKLGKNIPALLRDLWVDHIYSNGEGFIPQALKARIVPQTPNKSSPEIQASCFASDTRYSEHDYERLWSTVTDVVQNAEESRNSCFHESHWISYVVSPMLNLVSKLKPFNEDGTRVIALDVQTVNIDPPALCSYSSDDYFKDLDKRIDCALGLGLEEEEKDTLRRGVYDIEDAHDSINQTSSVFNFIPMFLNIEVKREHSDQDPLIQLAAWISAEFEKRRIEHYSLDMPVLAIQIVGDQWDLYMVYADEGLADGGAFGLRFMGPRSLGSTRSLQDCFKLLDGLCRCADWGVGKYRSWFRKEVLEKYS